MERQKEKAESIGVPSAWKEAGRNPSYQSKSIVTPCGCLRQGDFQTEKAVPVAPSTQLSALPWADLGARFCRSLF
jgi:hypothetical protein